MQTLRVIAIGALVGIGAWLGHASAQESGDAGRLTAQDYADIQQLYWRYNHGADFGDADLYVSVFTDDAALRGSDGQWYRGKDEISEFISRSLTSRPAGDTGRRHWNNSWRITPSAEGAKGRTYWLIVDVSSGQPKNSRSGYYEDVYVNSADGWLIKSRTIVGDDR